MDGSNPSRLGVNPGERALRANFKYLFRKKESENGKLSCIDLEYGKTRDDQIIIIFPRGNNEIVIDREESFQF